MFFGNIAANGRAVGAVRIINEKLNKMNESVIIQKLIQVGQMLERGELEYSGAEIDTKHYLEQYVALRQPHVVGRSEQCSGSLLSDEEIREAADEWVFDENGMKWSNNDGTAGDNYGSFIAGVKWVLSRICNGR